MLRLVDVKRHVRIVLEYSSVAEILWGSYNLFGKEADRRVHRPWEVLVFYFYTVDIAMTLLVLLQILQEGNLDEKL
jgi:hypothetical protein